MLRTLFLVLLLANGLLLAANSGLFDTGSDREREPERLQRQHQPGLVKVLDPQAAEAALAAASAAMAASAAQAAAACVEAGPYLPADAAVAERSLREAGLPLGSWQALRHDEGGAWMVYMGRYADREVLQRKLAELARLKLQAEDVRDAPALQPGLSLGRFDDAEAARAALAQLAQRGVRTARVITLQPPQTLTRLRLPAADGALRTRLAALPLPGGSGFMPCAAGSAPASAASAASAPSAASAASAATATASAPAPAAVVKPAAVAAPAPTAPAARASAAAAPVAPNPPPAAASPAVRASAPVPRPQVGAASAPAAPPASRARIASADTRAALQRAASAAAAEAAAARPAQAGSASASR